MAISNNNYSTTASTMQPVQPLKYDGNVTIAYGPSRKSVHWVNRTGKWSELVAALSTTIRTPETLDEYLAMTKDQQSDIKDVGGFVGGTLITDNSNRKKNNIKTRGLLTLDADFATPDFVQIVRDHYNNAFVIYSTHKHTPENPRLRLIMPLSRAVTPYEFTAISRRVADTIGIDFFDVTTHQAARLMYLPSTSRDGEYVFEMQDAPWLDADAILASYADWRDEDSWPYATSEKAEKHRHKAFGTTAVQDDPRKKPGIIGAFCRAYTVPEAIAKFLPDVYEEAGNDRYTYRDGSTQGGLVIYDDGLFAYSHHSTDIVHDRLVNAFDLVRLHLFSGDDDDAGVNDDTPMNERPSWKEMVDLVKDDDRARKELTDAKVGRVDFSQFDDIIGAASSESTVAVDGGSSNNGGGSGNGGNGASNGGHARKMHVPDYIFVPYWLRKTLTEMVVPDIIDTQWLIKLGGYVLAAKQMAAEESNNGKKVRVPDRLSFDEVAITMLSLWQFKNVQMTERRDDTILAIYDDDPMSERYGTYDTSRKKMYAYMERIAPTFKRRDMDDVLSKIERSVPSCVPTKSRHLFAVNNGIYDQSSKTLMPFDPKYVYLTKIPVDYHPSPVNPVITAPDGFKWDVESWIDDLMDGDKESAELLWQVIADCLQPNYSRNKSIWFYSEKGNNGKGTFGQLIKNLLGSGNYASLSVADFNHEFLKSTLLGVAANIADENDVDVYIDSVKDYKASITGDDININRKYEAPLRMHFFGTNIQMMNGMPKTKDKSNSFYRRLIIVPFLKSFTNNGERPYIKSDYIARRDVLEYVLYKALNMDFEEFIVPARSAELLEDYREVNNPVADFWHDLRDEFVWDLLPAQFLYDLFVKWFEINNPSGKVMSKRTFNTLLRAIIADDDEWEDRSDRNAKVRSAGKMDEDEPLISEYGLDRPDKSGKLSRWCNAAYNGNNPQKRRDFARAVMYSGYLRV